jgi:arylsulfatase A-like enzyme
MKFILVAALVFATAVPVFSRQEPPNPDILLIMPDQMRGDCISLLGHPVVRTPTIDKLARQGTIFRHAYSTCPSCIPARFSLLTGLYPSTSGVVGFKGKPITFPTLPHLLVENGYNTILIGRCMHQVPKDEGYGYEKEILGSTYISDDDYDNFLKKAAPETGGIVALTKSLGISANGWKANPWPLKEELHPTAWIVRQSRQILAAAAADKPVFLTTSFFSPHPPLFPPKRIFDYYMKQKLPRPAHGDWVQWDQLTSEGNKQGDRVLLEGEILRRAQAGYFGLTEFLDEQIAGLIEDFKARSTKAGHPWLIAFTTDHGEMLGDNGYFRKCEPYEGSANIPFILCGSEDLKLKAGQRSDALVCLEDLMPTFLAAAKAKNLPKMDGINLLPLLAGETAGTRPILHFEHAICYNKPQAFQALTDGRYKYIWRPEEGAEQLFDLGNDRYEEHDLTRVDAKKELVTKWRNQMIQILAKRPEGFSNGKRLIAGRPYPPLQANLDNNAAAKD